MIPNQFHFCFGFSDTPTPFLYAHYLAIRSAVVVNRPQRVTVDYHHAPRSPWWEKAQDLAEFRHVDPPREIFGRPLHHFAHRADVLRLYRLYQEGGIYLDMDTLCLRPFTPLLDNKTVMGQQVGRGLCNATILSQAGAPFLREWIDSYRSFRSQGHDRYWDEHSVILPNTLAARSDLSAHITILPPEAFFYPNFHQWQKLFEPDVSGFDQSYSVHLWETFSLPRLRAVTPEWAATDGSAYAQLIRRICVL